MNDHDVHHRNTDLDELLEVLCKENEEQNGADADAGSNDDTTKGTDEAIINLVIASLLTVPLSRDAMIGEKYSN